MNTSEARRLFDAGLPLLPNHPTDKYPKGHTGWESGSYDWPLLEQHLRSGGALGLRMSDDDHEAVDVDTKAWAGTEPDELRRLFEQLVSDNAPGLLERLVIQRTQSGGRHYVYRCVGAVCSNQKLAERPPTNEELAANPKARNVTLIETRGAGGQVQIAPSLGYTVLQGDLANVPEITTEERALLLNCARALTQIAPPSKIDHQAQRAAPAGEQPGDVYNANGGAAEALRFLEEEGWAEAGSRGGVLFLRRPGKARGVSGTFGHVAPGVFHCFTSNGSPFESDHGYSPFAVRTLLKFDGDYTACAKAIAEEHGMAYYPAGEPLDQSGVLCCPKHKTPLRAGKTQDWLYCPQPDKTERGYCQYSTRVPGYTPPEKPQAAHGNESRPRFVVRTLAELASVQPPRWSLPDEAIERGYHLIYGASGGGKTFYAIDRALRLAAAGRRVLYIATEDLAGLKVRVTAWRKAHPFVSTDTFTWLEMPEGLDLADSRQVDELLSTLAPFAFEHITIDTLREAHTGDENSSQDGGAVNRAVQLLIRGGASVDVVHHSGVEDKRPRGTTAVFANADMVIRVGFDGEHVTVHTDKVRNSVQPDDRRFVLASADTGLVDSEGQPITSAVLRTASAAPGSASAKLTRAHKSVLQALAYRIFAETGAKAQQLIEITELARRTVYQALSDLMDRGYIVQSAKGDPYTITPAGRAQLGPDYAPAPEPEPSAEVQIAPQSPSASSAEQVQTSAGHQGSVQVQVLQVQRALGSALQCTSHSQDHTPFTPNEDRVIDPAGLLSQSSADTSFSAFTGILIDLEERYAALAARFEAVRGKPLTPGLYALDELDDLERAIVVAERAAYTATVPGNG